MKAPSATVIVLLLILTQKSLFAQRSASPFLDPRKAITQFTIDTWDADRGLPQNSVNSILQTRDGYLWLATQEGVVRFDGVRFQVFDRSNTPQLKSNYIWILYEDSKQNLWIGTNGGGLTKYASGRFTTYATTDGLAGNIIKTIVEDAHGNIWCGTTTGLSKITGATISSITTAQGLESNNISALFVDQANNLWIGYLNASIGIYTKGVWKNLSRKTTLGAGPVSLFHRDRAGTMWVGSGNSGLYKISVRPNGDIEYLRDTTITTQPAIGILSLYEDNAGALWIGTAGNGLLRMYQHTVSSITSEEGLADDFVKTIYQDREGSLWIGTYSGGLNRLRDGKFTTLSTLEGLSNDFALSITEGKNGEMWFGTYGGGLNRYARGTFRHFNMTHGLSNEIISSIFVDSDSTLWVGTYGGGLYSMHDTLFTSFSSDDGSPGQMILAITESKDKTLWVGTSKGLCRVQNGGIVPLTQSPILSRESIQSLLEASDGTLWVGTNGSGIFGIQQGKLRTYTTKNGLSNDIITALYEDRQHVLWIGTDGGGLNRLVNGKITSVTSQQGLFNDVVFVILEDARENLWMSCNKGIFRVAKKELQDFAEGRLRRIHSDVFTRADGMKANECNGRRQPSGWKSRDGKLWFATIHGVASIDPERIPTNEFTPPVLIERLLINGREQHLSGRLTFSPDGERYEIDYTALSLLAPEKVRFRYRIEGADDAWFEAGTNRKAIYTHLPAGDYVFHVIACNNDGVWNTGGASIAFTIEPYFYKTYWFFGVCFLAIVALVVGAYSWRMRRIKAWERQLVDTVKDRTKNLEEEKEKTLRALHETEIAHREAEIQKQRAQEANDLKTELLNIASHDMRNPLQNIIGFSEIIGDEVQHDSRAKEFAEIITRSARYMAKMIDDLLEAASLESGKLVMNNTRVELCALVEEVCEENRLRAMEKQQRIELFLDGTCAVSADKNRLREAVENLVSNAIKYSPSGSPIRVTCSKNESHVTLHVQDQGPGFTEEDKKKMFGKFQRLSAQPTGGESATGLGLSIAKQIIDLHGGTIRCESDFGKGSTFVVELPLVGDSR